MKKLLTATLIALSLSSQASDFSAIKAASISFVSSYSNAVVATNADKGDILAFGTYSSVTHSFCGVSRANGDGIIAYGFDNTLFQATHDDLYMVVCIKSGGLSDDVVVVIADPSFFGISQRSNEQPSEMDIQRLESAFSEILE